MTSENGDGLVFSLLHIVVNCVRGVVSTYF